ncbi:hypothetical protein [Microlunatus sp. GCM10028923]|uniref:hypothetical protein n=1 Tax=Microlunatus sp. GCM10028923 TaxID=3273400 RepID=UPI003607AEFE
MADLFAKGQRKVKDLRSAHANVVVERSGVKQNWVFDLDLKLGEFRGTIDVTSGATKVMSQKIVRANGLTWLMAPEEFWVSAGYPAEGAAKARGKYVVFKVAEGNALAERYSVDSVITAIDRIRERDVRAVPAESDAEKVTFVASPGTSSETRMTFRRSDSQLVGLRSDAAGVKTELVLSKHNDPLDVKFPSPGDVLQP